MKRTLMFMAVASALLICSLNSAADDCDVVQELEICEKPDMMPAFRDGVTGLMMYLSENIHYPKAAVKQKIEGRVLVGFVVTETGKIKEVKVVKGVHSLLDQEAVRVTEAMPDWIPGKYKGKSVNVRYSIPVAFKLH